MQVADPFGWSEWTTDRPTGRPAGWTSLPLNPPSSTPCPPPPGTDAQTCPGRSPPWCSGGKLYLNTAHLKPNLIHFFNYLKPNLIHFFNYLKTCDFQSMTFKQAQLAPPHLVVSALHVSHLKGGHVRNQYLNSKPNCNHMRIKFETTRHSSHGVNRVRFRPTPHTSSPRRGRVHLRRGLQRFHQLALVLSAL